MGSMGNLKLIAVTPENYWHLKNLGKAGGSFNDVVTRILKERGSKGILMQILRKSTIKPVVY